MTLSNKKFVLVTGGAGYIGSHTCKALALSGYVPVTLDNLVYGHRSAVKWGPFEEGCIGDQKKVGEILRRYQPLAAIHFAAYTYVGESVLDPVKYYRNNTASSLSFLESILRHAPIPVIFSSTCAVYGMPQYIPIKESHPQHPINPYGFSKHTVERLLTDFEAAYQMPYVALRYFNACGADIDGEIGEAHDPETHLIPLVIETALGKRPPLEIYGTDYPTPDGTAIRDYIHVADLADAHVKALDYALEGNKSTSFNIGTGKGYSVREIIQAVEKVSGIQIAVQEAPRRIGDPPILLADTALSRGSLNWKPKFSELDFMIKTAWEWHSKQNLTAEALR